LSTICLLISKGYTKQNQLEYSGVDGRIILRWIYRKWDGGRDWIDLAQNRDRWRVLVNAVMELGVG
jgi:hypothetical protein